MATYVDPPGMPEDERMTPAELRVVREYLGLSGEALAGLLGVSARTIRHWEGGVYPIPDGVRIEVEAIEAETAEAVSAVIGRLNSAAEVRLVTYRSDAEYRQAHPEVRFPASWHRAVVARVAQEVPGVSISYPLDVVLRQR